jgi:AraC-like DNA-binding protein
MNYIGKKRILYAETLLAEGMTPTEVAKECGYDTYTTFYRQYKKHTGRAPRG